MKYFFPDIITVRKILELALWK